MTLLTLLGHLEGKKVRVFDCDATMMQSRLQTGFLHFDMEDSCYHLMDEQGNPVFYVDSDNQDPIILGTNVQEDFAMHRNTIVGVIIPDGEYTRENADYFNLPIVMWAT